MFRRHQDTDLIRDHWDSRAATFDEQAGHGLVGDAQRQAWHVLLSRHLGDAPQRVLDVGCGTGFLALRLAELGHVVSGVDLSGRMIEQARRKASEAGLEIDYRVGDGANLDFADESYDAVVARHVIWNLPDPQRGLAEWLRVLHAGGRLLLVEGKWADNEDLRDHRRTAAIRARVLDLAALVVRGGRYRPRVLIRRYRRLEARLPFAGGPDAGRLVAFLEANSVHDVQAESLMDPTLWGESPEFPRYLVAGTRGTRSAGGGGDQPLKCSC